MLLVARYSEYMNSAHKNVAIALMIFCSAFFLYAEWAVYQHYLVINRDFYPVMSEFYKMYAERFGNFLVQLAGINVGFRVATTTVIQEIA